MFIKQQSIFNIYLVYSENMDVLIVKVGFHSKSLNKTIKFFTTL